MSERDKSQRDPASAPQAEELQSASPWFEQAARATRQRYDGQSPRAAHTERRLLSVAQVRRRKITLAWLFPPAAALAVSVASAGHVQRGADWVVQRVEFWLSPDPAVFAPREAQVAEPGEQQRQEQSAPPATRNAEAELAQLPSAASYSVLLLPSVPAPVGETAPQVGPDPLRARPTPTHSSDARARPNSTQSSTQSSAQSTAPTPPSPSSKSDLQLYRAAHQAHFVQQDYSVALRAWDEYLELANKGQFVPEARFNRALALLQLGRTQAAILALQPFAQGAYGSYRAAEARALLQKLQGSTSMP